jgi:hypothetical protein
MKLVPSNDRKNLPPIDSSLVKRMTEVQKLRKKVSLAEAAEIFSGGMNLERTRRIKEPFAGPAILRYVKRPWKPEEDGQLREMAEAGKNITMIALSLERTVTAVRGRLGILKISVRKVRPCPQKNPPA